jgi:murein DD-endopeptidase MepM/ murein hydrolase activator NlpD
LNKAQADMNCKPDGNGQTNCNIVVDPCDVYDCNEDPNPTPDPGSPPEPGDGNGGGGSEPPASTNPNLKDIDNDGDNDCWKGLVSSNARGANIGSDWGWRQYRGGDFHPGWDIGTAGQTDVNALFWGNARVLNSGFTTANGNFVEYQMLNTGYFVKIIHLAERPTVKTGAVYNMGDVAGKVGKTGATTAIHVHMVIYPSLAAYNNAMAEKGKLSTKAARDQVDFRTTIDPAKLFSSAACKFPSTVTDANNNPWNEPPPAPPCAGCSIP